jgi:hypothetical protein
MVMRKPMKKMRRWTIKWIKRLQEGGRKVRQQGGQQGVGGGGKQGGHQNGHEVVCQRRLFEMFIEFLLKKKK